MQRFARPLVLTLLVGLFVVGVKLRGVTGAELAAARILAAAQPLYQSLTSPQQKLARFAFDAPEKKAIRLTPDFNRPGYPVLTMSPRQREMALKLLQATLSESGWKKVKGIMDQPRNQGLNGQGVPNWDYCLAFFGEPVENGTWGYRWERHHVSITVDIMGGKVAKFHTALLGSNPNPAQGVGDPLEAEANLAKEIVGTMTDEQKAKATLPAKTGGVGQAPIPPKREGGIPVAQLSEQGQKLAAQLVEENLNLFPEDMTAEPKAATSAPAARPRAASPFAPTRATGACAVPPSSANTAPAPGIRI